MDNGRIPLATGPCTVEISGDINTSLEGHAFYTYEEDEPGGRHVLTIHLSCPRYRLEFIASRKWRNTHKPGTYAICEDFGPVFLDGKRL